jgi:hypothetical protein
MRRLTKEAAKELAESILQGMDNQGNLAMGITRADYLTRFLLVLYERGRLDGAFPGEEDGNE